MPKRRALSSPNVPLEKKIPRINNDSASSSSSVSSDSDSDDNDQNISYRLLKPTFPLEQSSGYVKKYNCEDKLDRSVVCVSKHANDSNCPLHTSTLAAVCQKKPFAEAISEPAFPQNAPLESGSAENKTPGFPAEKTAGLQIEDSTALGPVSCITSKCEPISLATVQDSSPLFSTKETAEDERSVKVGACTSSAVCEPETLAMVVKLETLEKEDNASSSKSPNQYVAELTSKDVQKEGGGGEEEEDDELQIVIVEDTYLEKKLEDDAQQHNLTATNVKNILHEVITNEHVIAMMRAALNNVDEAPIFEPKMTRSKAKEASEKGSQPQFLEIPLEEEDSSDEEYQPEEEEDDTAEETLLESDLENSLVVECVSPISPGHHRLRRSSCVSDVEDEGSTDAQSIQVEEPQPTIQKVRHISAMVVPMGPPPPLPAKDSTFIEKLNAVDEELAFSSIVGYQYRPDDENLIAYRTRSKRTLRDMPIGQLEAELNAPDITPDMYEPAVTEDEDWKTWLHGLMTDPVDNAEDNDDEEDDPEYNFLEDLDEPDVEDFRNDRSVRISKKEVNELMEELFETFGDEAGSQEWEEEVEEEADQQEADFNTPQTIRFEEPLANVIMDCRQTVKTQLDLLRMRKSNIKKKAPNSPGNKEEEKKVLCSFSLSPEQHTMLQQQMQQHVQLLTQVNLLSTDNPSLSSDAHLCRTYLQELYILGEMSQTKYRDVNSAFRSSFIPCNLMESLCIVDDFDKSEKTKSIKNNSKKDKKLKSSEKGSIKGSKLQCPAKLACIIMKSQVFMYRELLPCCMLHPPQPKEKIFFTNGEDNLLVLGLKHFEKTSWQKTLISQYLMPPKSMQQISFRIKNLMAARSSNNVVKTYKKTGVVPVMPKPCVDVLPEEAVAPIDRDPRDIPQWLRKCISVVKSQQNIKESVTPQSPPTALPDVNEQLHENETAMPQSPPKVTVTEEDPQSTKESKRVEDSKSPQGEMLQSSMQSVTVMENDLLGCFNVAGDEGDLKVNATDKTRSDCEGGAQVDEQEEEELTQEEEEEDDSSSESGDSALSVPELQETIDKLSWLASDTRANNPGGDSEDDIISQEETSEQDEEEEETTEPAHNEQENKWNPVIPAFSSSPPAPVEESVISNVEIERQLDVAPKKKVAIKVKPKRTRYRACMDTSKMLLLLGDDILETDPQRDKKDLIFAQAYLNKVKETLQHTPGKYEEFLKILHNFEMNHAHRSVVDMYEELHNAFKEWPELLKEFAVFLLPDQALECGLFEEQQDFEKGRTFLRQLEICFGENPSYYQKIVKALQSCVKFTNEEVNELKTQMWHLMKNHNYLQDVFSMFFDHLKPPTSRMDDFEEVNWTDEKEYKFDGFEEVVLPKLKKYNKEKNKDGPSSSGKDDISTAGAKPCTCTCHEVTNTELKPKKCKKRCLICVNKISGNVKIGKRKEIEHLSRLTEQDPPTQVTESLSPLKKSEGFHNNIDDDGKYSVILQTHKNTDFAQTNEANFDSPILECQSIVQTGPTVDSPTRDHKSTPTCLHKSERTPSDEKSLRVSLDANSADEKTSKTQLESCSQPKQSSSRRETTTECATEIVPSLARSVKAKEHGSGTVQSGNSKHQAEPLERLHVVCAKNSTVSSTGELVVLWTREADKIILTTCQEKGANGATFTEVAKLLGNKSSQEVSRRFRELVRLFHTAAAAVSPCQHSDEEEEEDSASNSLEPLSDRDSVATDDEIS
ncbi:GON-4-like protein [Petromyzon marinus]|uniref:GON-4-like protein n=1 Tax=Petromyzon marinus TaxID=7757 RepID=UPI003F6EE1CC